MTTGDAVQRLVDRAEIREAVAAYCRYADLNRPEDQVAVFVEDCRVSYGGPGRWIEGREALLASLRRALAAYSATSHLLGPSEIDLAGDRAAVTTAVHARHRRADGADDVVLYGRYVDEWVRTADGWRIAVREFRTAGATGRSEEALTPVGRRPSTAAPAPV